MRSIGCFDCQKKWVDFSSDKLVAYTTEIRISNSKCNIAIIGYQLAQPIIEAVYVQVNTFICKKPSMKEKQAK